MKSITLISTERIERCAYLIAYESSTYDNKINISIEIKKEVCGDVIKSYR